MRCPACEAENAAQAQFCVSCGATMPARCPQCAAPLPAQAKFCPNCGRPLQAATVPAPRVPAGKLPSAGERKQITVLFADLCGFTPLAEKLDAEEVRDIIDSLWARLDPVIVSHGGIVNQHVGDEIMALFGAAVTRENDPQQAVRAALGLQAALAQFNHEHDGRTLQLRVGIHTGPVVLGHLATTGEFTATGDTVNLTSRLEHNAPVGGILISHDTYRQVSGLFDVRKLSPLTVKGRAEPILVYQILRAKPRALAWRVRGIEGVQTPMIGREAELTRLQEAFQSVLEDRECQLITIVGEGGIGKSRLLHEFQQWLEVHPETFRFFSGRAVEETAQLPFALMRDVFSVRFDIQESDLPDFAREKFVQGYVRFMRAARVVTEEDPVAQAHFIGQLLGFDFSASPHLRGILNDPDQIRQRAFHYLGNFFALASHGTKLGDEPAPTRASLVVLEDVHWSDESSLDLIGHLARACRKAPLMIVCLARPVFLERRPSWGEGLPGYSRINLVPLSRRESRALVDSILRHTPEIPQALRELVVGGAEGIPFYIEETIQMLIDGRVIIRSADHWRIQADRLAAATIPPTLTGILQARLDALSPVERTVLQRASVVGRTFWDSALEHLSASSPGTPDPGRSDRSLTAAEVREALLALRRKELIYQPETSAFAGTLEYTFKHELLRKVTYEGVLKKLRRAYHAQAGRWLIEQSGERVMGFAGLVASHFEQAQRPLEAAEWYGRAGQQARMSYTPASAIDCFKKALALLPEEARTNPAYRAPQIEWLDGLAEVLSAQARYEEAQRAYETVQALAEPAGDLLTLARVQNGLAFLHERQGRYRASVESATQAAEFAHQSGDSASARRERVRALNFKGWAFYRLGDAAAVLALGEQTLKLCSEFEDRRGSITSLKLHGVAHLQLGRFAEANRFFEQGLALCRELGDRRNAAAMLSNLGESARLSGDSHGAVELYQKALALAREIGHRESEVIYLNNLGGARLGLGEFAQAEVDLRQAISLTAMSRSGSLSESYTFLAHACLGQGKIGEALAAAQVGLKLARESEGDLDQGGAWRALGQAAARQRIANPAAALRTADTVIVPQDPRACFQQSLAIFRKINAQAEQARTLFAWAEYEWAAGDPASSQKLREEAQSISERLGMKTGGAAI